jgi:DNA repair exonuclease SbcCD ATPase subunit
LDANNELKKISTDMKKLTDARSVLYAADSSIEEINNSIKPTREELNKLKFNKQKLEEYTEEMEVYKSRYEKTETVKKYTSPTGEGIQLIFMDMYMHDILTMANTLLAKLFNGQFMLQPFVINGDEFRIPCVGNRLMNDDISSMSTGQICMISMILSFSILFNSASNYNILRLDEIDGGLDTDNRIKFIEILNEVMDILGCEQCFLISHNEEIQYSSTDMILLRTNSENLDYGNANIIFDIRCS